MLRTPQVARREAPAGALPRARSSAFAGAPGRRLVWLLAAAYAILYGSLCAIKYRYYLYQDFDLAIFAQAVDGLLRGTMYSSIRGMNWLGDHSSLNLFLIAPLDALFRTPLTLLTLQSAALALGAIPVYATARRTLGDGFAAVACAALYLAYPALGYTNLYEFHPEVLSTTPLLFLLDAVHAGRPRAAALWAFLALLGKEDVALFVMALGVLVLARRGPHRAAIASTLLGLGALFLAITFLAIKPRLSGAEASYGDMYSQWGPSPRGVVLGLLRHPLGAIRAFFDTPGDPLDAGFKRWFHVHLLLPLGLLPLAAPFELVPAVPILAEHLLSWRTPQHQIAYQYTALLTPAYVFAAIAGLANLNRRLAPGPAPVGAWRKVDGVAAAACALSLASNLAFGPLRDGPGLGLPAPQEHFRPTAEERTIAPERDRMLRALPPRGAIVASFPYLAHLGRRDSVISAHHVLSGKFTFSRMSFPTPVHVSAALLDATKAFVDDGSPARLRALVAVNRLRPVRIRGSAMLFVADRRDSVEWISFGVPAESTARSVVFDDGLELVAGRADSSAEAGGNLTIRTIWRRVGDVDDLMLTQWALLDPMGRLVVTGPHVLGDLFHLPGEWPVGVNVRETDRMVLDAHLAPGAYRIAVRVGQEDENGDLRDAVSDAPDSSAVVDLGWIEVRARAR